MPVIYQPQGKAREYSPLACNIYLGCDHGCHYCFCPSALRRPDANAHPLERKDFLANLEKELKAHSLRSQVLLCFMGDPYCHLDEKTGTTRKVLELFLEHKVPTAILTKGGRRALRDLDLFKQFGKLLKFGSTLTFVDDEMRAVWEPNASETMERIDVLREIHEAGVKTWASIEPVVDPDESLAAMALSIPCVDEYRIGKLNHSPEQEKKVDWTNFLTLAVDLMRDAHKRLYIKESLRAFANLEFLRPEECDADALTVKA